MKLETILATKGTTVATIKPEATIRELLAVLSEKRYGAMVVSEDGETIAGIVSERDIVRALAVRGAALLDERVSAIMTPHVQCAPTDAKVADVMALMTEERFRHVPVLDEDLAMVGIVSIGDIVKSRVGELQGQRDALISYVTNGG